MSQKMGKIALNTGYYSMEVKEYPVPEAKDDGAVIQIETFCICGSDQHFVKIPGSHAGGTEGHEFMGKVISLGADANKTLRVYGGELHVGDRIVVYPHITCGKCDTCKTYGDGVCGVCDDDYIYGGVFNLDSAKVLNHDAAQWPHFKGGFSEYCYLFPGTYVWKVPDDMPGEVAALLDPCAVAMRAVEQVMTSIGGTGEGFSLTSRCLVIGAGAISIMAAMILRSMGARQIIITDFFDEKLAMAKEIAHVDHAVNVAKMTSDERVAKILELTDGGAEVVINGANHPSTCIEGLRMVRKLGHYVEIGNAMDFGRGYESQINIPAVVFERNAHITSVVANTPQCFSRAFEYLKRWKELPFEKLITHRFTKLEDIIPVMKKMGDPDFIKAACTFKD